MSDPETRDASRTDSVMVVLSRDQALVLFEMVANANEERLAILDSRPAEGELDRDHPQAFDAEQIVWSELESLLQDFLVSESLSPDYGRLIEEAKERIMLRRYGPRR